ncbi:hypothetical protein PENTCL1PPCAC_6156, partial [Pristionchus entomophagus]
IEVLRLHCILPVRILVWTYLVNVAEASRSQYTLDLVVALLTPDHRSDVQLYSLLLLLLLFHILFLLVALFFLLHIDYPEASASRGGRIL